ncbi:hypothetical protein [Polyangium aurulentum]|uniref:hypothetical protein n=1 Tax=Polyangium aurulentum TaxID=2567896 RepID=UPI0010AE41EE|nr:hypothetical protein [Polyangium aurulentum]UQA63126.1 hypothetical protein E8A73_022750 [Polyangium aurulentum]
MPTRRSLLSTLCATAALVCVPNAGRAEDEEPFTAVDSRDYGLGTVSMYLRYAHSRDSARLAGLSDLVVGGLSARAVYGKRIGYGVGAGLELGGGGAPGFAYSFELYPLGGAVALGPTGFLGVFLGVGVNGVTARVPVSLALPAELRLEFDWTRRARLGALFAVAWHPAQDARIGGSLLLPFVDETTMALTARFGKTFPRYRANMGRGYFFRLERKEQMRTVLFGLAFGVEIDAAN